MKLHIKRVLNIQSDDSTLDRYIANMFNINNLNPTYVFRIPDTNNRTLVLRNSDFTNPIYPNITNVNKFTKNNNVLKAASSSQYQVRVKSEEVLDELRQEKLIFQKNLNGNYEDSDYDDNMRKILEENVRSEGEFSTLLNELNENLKSADLSHKQNKRMPLQAKAKNNNSPKSEKSTGDEWSALGLDGWSGLIRSSKDDLPKKGR